MNTAVCAFAAALCLATSGIQVRRPNPMPVFPGEPTRRVGTDGLVPRLSSQGPHSVTVFRLKADK